MNYPVQAPLVSIVIISDSSEWLGECIESTLSQDYLHTEIVVQSIGSDKEIERFCAYHKAIHFSHSSGETEVALLAKAIANTRGRYIKFVRSCDRITPDCISQLVEAIGQTPGTLLAFSLSNRIDTYGKITGVDQRISHGSSLQTLDGNSLRRRIVSQCQNLIGEPSSVLFDGPWLRQRNGRIFSGRITQHRFNALHWISAYCNAAEERPVIFLRAALASCRSQYPQTLRRDISIEQLDDWRMLINEVKSTDTLFSCENVFAVNAYNNLIADLAATCPDKEQQLFGRRISDEENPQYTDYLTCRRQIAEGHAKEGISKLYSLAELKTSVWQVYDALADIALAQNDDKSALVFLEIAAHKAGKAAAVALKLATLLIGTFRQREGKDCIERYLAHNPEDSTARQLLASIEATSQAHASNSTLSAYACLEGNYDEWQARTGLYSEQEEAEKTFEFVILAYTGDTKRLADTIDSIAGQNSPCWRLTILAEFPPPDPSLSEDEVVTWQTHPDAKAISAALQDVASNTPAEWLILSESGTIFSADYLNCISSLMRRKPEVQLVYVDDDHLDSSGKRCLPRFKPDFDPDYFYVFNYIRDIAISKQAMLASTKNTLVPGAEVYDLTLRVFDGVGEAAIGHLDHVLVHLPIVQSLIVDKNDAEQQALEQHFRRRSEAVKIATGYCGSLRIVHHALETSSLVSIIIPRRNELNLTKSCIESILTLTQYPNWEIILVDSDHQDPATSLYYEQLRLREPERVRILEWQSPFNRIAMTNAGAKIANGDYLLLICDGICTQRDNWLDEMMRHSRRQEIGIVGARLTSPCGTRLENAGIVLGMNSGARPILSGLPIDQAGYMFRAQATQCYSAVSGDCLLIKKHLFEEAGRLNGEFGASFGHTDLCLKVRSMGYRILWTPEATLAFCREATVPAEAMENEKAILQQESHALFNRWREWLTCDPAWNRNLSLTTPQPTIESEILLPIAYRLSTNQIPNIIGMPLGAPGTLEYRTVAPFRALKAQSLAHGTAICAQNATDERTPTPIELARIAPQTLLIQAPVDDARLFPLLHYQKLIPEMFRIYSLDDLITDIPSDNPVSVHLPAKTMVERLRIGARACQRAIVTTEPLAKLLKDISADVRIVPNMIERRLWGNVVSTKRKGPRIRIGWAGAQQHAGDLRFVREVIAATCSEVDWVFFGMQPENSKSFGIEFHDFVHHFDAYPEKLASLDLDLAIAPLAIHPFNEAKSNLRLLEYGFLGWPVICTDIFPYRTNNPPVTRLSNDASTWIRTIRGKIADRESLVREGKNLQQWVLDNYILEDHLDRWIEALTPPSIQLATQHT